jgi:hypothetical protein
LLVKVLNGGVNQEKKALKPRLLAEMVKIVFENKGSKAGNS